MEGSLSRPTEIVRYLDSRRDVTLRLPPHSMIELF